MFKLVLKVPATHGAHSRPRVEEPALLTYEPGPQLANGMHAVAFIPMLYIPAAHAPHVRSLAGLPSAFTGEVTCIDRDGAKGRSSTPMTRVDNEAPWVGPVDFRSKDFFSQLYPADEVALNFVD